MMRGYFGEEPVHETGTNQVVNYCLMVFGIIVILAILIGTYHIFF